MRKSKRSNEIRKARYTTNEREKKVRDFLTLGFLLIFPAAWITHVIHCLIAAKYLLLIAGALIFPVGIIHGVGLWFGASW